MTNHDELFLQMHSILGEQAVILTGNALLPYLTGFRGKHGTAIALVEPHSTVVLYELIQLLVQHQIGYVMQGANTSLKGQSIPNEDKYSVVIIKTTRLKQFKIIDIPNESEYKILLTEPGLSVKEAEHVLDEIEFDLPHKIGSHDFGNTFGASCAIGCGGVRVDNRDGRASKTDNDNLGVIAISANGYIYNGFIKPECVQSGKELLSKIDRNDIAQDDIIFPKLNEIALFLDQLFIDRSYPIKNHRGDIIFSGDGGEGSQVIVYLMYLIRRKVTDHQTYVCILKDEKIKDALYQKVVLNLDQDKKEYLPIVCESMNATLVHEIVNKGTGFLTAALLSVFPDFFKRYSPQLMRFRNRLVNIFSLVYLHAESFLGKVASYFLPIKALKEENYHEIVLLQYANRSQCKDSIAVFEEKFNAFCEQQSTKITLLKPEKNSISERLMLQVRTAGALATLTVSQREKGVLFAFDDAVMPGEMLSLYCNKLFTLLSEQYAGRVLSPLLYGHDLKQISHNDWIIRGKLSSDEIKNIHHMQHKTMIEVGGHPHAEHGVGDYADTDLNEDELVKLIVHRVLNDANGFANPGGAYEKAFQNALKNKEIVNRASEMIQAVIERELSHRTLLRGEALSLEALRAHVTQMAAIFLKSQA